MNYFILATFNTGNLETMKLIDPKYLKTWFAENYTSNKMNLSILGKDDLPQLISYAEKYFSPIKSTDKKAIKSFGRITPEKLSKSLLYIEPLKDLKDVSLSWEIPYDAISDLDTKPGKLVGHGTFIARKKTNIFLKYSDTKAKIRYYPPLRSKD